MFLCGLRGYLKINLEKSKIIHVGRVINVKALASVLCCKVRKLPTSYLSLPLGAFHKYPKVWNVAEEKFQRKLSMWKR